MNKTVVLCSTVRVGSNFFYDLINKATPGDVVKLQVRPKEGCSKLADFYYKYPDAYYVWIRRENKLEQAISLHRAIQNKQWNSGEPKRFDRERYSKFALDKLMGMIEQNEADLQEYFEGHGIKPLIITYEKIAENPRREVRRVLWALRLWLKLLTYWKTDSEYQKQGDELNMEWEARYKQEE